MAKYNITERKEKKAAYRTMVNQRLAMELKEKIVQIICIRKKYRDKKFTAKRLADELKTNTRYVSAVVNLCFGQNYTSFINSFRIEEAKMILEDPQAAELTMKDVSDMVGFANRQSFYASFYRMTGISPCEYRKQNLSRGAPHGRPHTTDAAPTEADDHKDTPI